MYIQWYGKIIDKWQQKREGNEATIFEVCPRCYDDIECGEINPSEHLIPSHNEPQDRFLMVAEYKSYGKCLICKGVC